MGLYEDQRNQIERSSKTEYIELLLSQIGDVLDEVGLPYYTSLYLGIDEINELLIHEENLIKKIDENPYKTEFEPEQGERSFFKMLMGKVNKEESVLLISVALPYPKTPQTSCISEGLIDGSSLYYDYHQILKEKMKNAFETFLRRQQEAFSVYDCFVDTSNFIDRELAFLCGLGNYGKNHMLIHSELGTQFHIGHMYIVLEGQLKSKFSKVMTGDELEAQRIYKGCEACKKCIIACPSKICGTSHMNRLKCISYFTQTKKDLTIQQMVAMENRLYGCDMCQRVCPANNVDENKINPVSIEHWQSKTAEGIGFFELFSMSQKSFKRQYGNRGFAWRGLNVFKRNALIAVGNAENTKLSERVKTLKEIEANPKLKPYYDYAIKILKSV